MPTFIQSFHDKSQNKFGTVLISCLKEGTMSLPDFSLLVKKICMRVCDDQINDFDILFSKYKILECAIVEFDKKYLEDINILKIII